MLAVGLTACPGSTDDKRPPRARVDVPVATAATQIPSGWCGEVRDNGEALAFVMPATVTIGGSGSVPIPRPGRFTWINLWATWCAPCVREMPYLVRIRDRLRGDGVPFDLIFVSVDDSDEIVQQYLSQNPAMAAVPMARVASSDDLDAWLPRYGLDTATSIPVQVLAGPDRAVRCVRAGSMAEGDYTVVRALIQ
jgi:thiol-disulfide isomerase/thioredoxin